jgi:pantetheine-phosphate adenylyltransferase
MNKKRSSRLFKRVAVGGTFDKFHKGHIKLLERAFSIGKYVIIGLSTDSFVKKLNKPHKVDMYEDRLSELSGFLDNKGYLNKAEIITLDDHFGIAASKPELEAIVVSEKKRHIAIEINKLRCKKGLKPLEVISIDMVLASDYRPISTTRIRRGAIDREGKVLKDH